MSATDEALGVVSKRTGTRWLPVIGLEIHCQLKTWTKLFCGCRNEFGAPPNSHVCAVCSGQPGALPVLNEEALRLALRTALAVGAEVAPWSQFDRKNYFYCDLPKGYQISQFAHPYCAGGGLELVGGKFVRLTRIHMEEDAGKAIHDRGDATLVDLNRAGVPLIEAVTEADLASAAEADEFLVAYKELLQYIGASDCDMEKGSLRCDVNVSVHREGEPWGTKVELKNLNSFRNVRASIEYEIARQIEAYESGDESRFPVQETRLFDADRGETRTMRGKEDAHDYRYFPDPDLPRVSASEALIEKQRSLLPELPAARRARYQGELGLSPYDAGVLTGSRALADFFEATARLSGNPSEAAKWIANDLSGHLSDPELAAESVDDLPCKPFDLAELIELVEKGRIHKGAARKVLRVLVEKGGAPGKIVQQLGLETVSDPDQLEQWCRTALEGRESIAEQVREGKEKAIGALMGPVMQASGGRADPGVVRETLLRLIRDGE